MSNHYNVLMAREYTTKDGETKSAFTKIGVAFPMKDKDGFQVSLEAIPLQSIGKTGKLECKLLLMPPMENNQTDETTSKISKGKAAVDSDSIPF